MNTTTNFPKAGNYAGRAWLVKVVLIFQLLLQASTTLAQTRDAIDVNWFAIPVIEPQIQIPITTGHPRKNYMEAMIESLQFSSDSKQIITADRTGQVCYWNLDDRKLAKAVKFPIKMDQLPKRDSRIGTVYSQPTIVCRISPHGKYFLREVFSDRLFLFDMITGTSKELPIGQDWKQIGEIVDHFSPDDSMLLLEVWPNRTNEVPFPKSSRVQLWDASTGLLQWEATIKHTGLPGFSSIVFLADNKTVLIDNQTRDLKTGERKPDRPVVKHIHGWVTSPDRESVMIEGPEEIFLTDGKRRSAPPLDHNADYKSSSIFFNPVALAGDRRSFLASMWGYGNEQQYRLAWCEWPTGKVRAVIGFAKSRTIQHVKTSEDGKWLGCVAPDQALILVWNLHDLPVQTQEKRLTKSWLEDWNELSSMSGIHAWQAMYRMLAEPSNCVTLLRKQISSIDSSTSTLQVSETLQLHRAIEVLCIIDSAESRQLLKEWSQTASAQQLRVAAKQGLNDLEKDRKAMVIRPSR